MGGGGWLPIMHHRSHHQGVCIQGSLPPGVGSAYGGGGGRNPPVPQDTWDTTGYGQQAGVRILLECILA